MRKIKALLLALAMLASILPTGMVSAANEAEESFTADSSGVYWMEAEDATWTGDILKDNKDIGYDKPSSGSFVTGWDTSGSPASSKLQNNETMTFPITSSAAGTYDVWSLAWICDPSTASAETYSLKAEGGADEILTSTKGDLTTLSESLYTLNMTGGGTGGFKWIKIGQATLEAGKNYRLNVTTGHFFAESNKWFGMDCVVMTPASFSWTPSGLTKPTAPVAPVTPEITEVAKKTYNNGYVWEMKLSNYEATGYTYKLTFKDSEDNTKEATINFGDLPSIETKELLFNVALNLTEARAVTLTADAIAD